MHPSGRAREHQEKREIGMKAKWSYRGRGLGPRDAAACVIDTRHHGDIERLTEMILEQCLSKKDLAHMLAYGMMIGSEERRLCDAMAKAEEFMIEHKETRFSAGWLTAVIDMSGMRRTVIDGREFTFRTCGECPFVGRDREVCRHPSNLGGATEYDDIPKGCPLKEVRTWGWR